MKKLLFGLTLLAFISSCKKDDNSPAITAVNVSSTVSTGTWRITYFLHNTVNETSGFTGYNFTFGAANVATAVKTGSATVTGTWAADTDDSTVKLELDFISPSSFENISEDWHVIERTNTRIRLQDNSGGTGVTDFLTFEKN